MKYRWLPLLFVLFCLGVFKAEANAGKILVIDSYHASYPWTSECRQGFNDAIDPSHGVTFFEMDTKRVNSYLFQQKADAAWQVIQETRPDIVVTMDDNALKFLGQKISDIGIPVVFMGVNQNPRGYFRGQVPPGNVTGVLERPPLKRSIYSISQLIQTKNKRILLMMDNEMTSHAIIQSSLTGQKTFQLLGMTLETFLTNSFEQWTEKIHNTDLDTYDALIIANYAALKDNTGKQVPLDTTSEWTSRHSNIPVFAFWKYSVGKGKALGGFIISGYYQGSNAAKLANKILSTGKIPATIVPVNAQYTFSTFELKRWGITLPKSISPFAQLEE